MAIYVTFCVLRNTLVQVRNIERVNFQYTTFRNVTLFSFQPFDIARAKKVDEYMAAKKETIYLEQEIITDQRNL